MSLFIIRISHHNRKYKTQAVLLQNSTLMDKQLGVGLLMAQLATAIHTSFVDQSNTRSHDIFHSIACITTV